MSWKDLFPKENIYFEAKDGLLYQGHVLDILESLPDESIDCIITSPPYWSLRDYGEETNTIWGGDESCEHEWETEIRKNPLDRGGKGQFDEYRHFGTLMGSERTTKPVKSGFCNKCGAFYGQLGLEPSLDLYIDHMLQITKELKRVLKKTGVMFWNQGDNYSTGNAESNWANISEEYLKNHKLTGNARIGKGHVKYQKPVPQKCMCLQNYRLILRMIDEQGWILRNIIVWHKPNHMPSSVKDRFTNAYEPVFFLTKSKNYWFDLDAVRVPYSESGKQRRKYAVSKFKSNPNNPMGKLSKGLRGGSEPIFLPEEPHPLGKNPGDIWTIPTQPFPEAHFAVFGERLIEPMVKAGCPAQICRACGKARVRIIKPTERYQRLLGESWNKEKSKKIGITRGNRFNKLSPKERYSEYYTIGWTDCGCTLENKWQSGIVLDPFMGSGTSGVVARKLGRNWIGIELNPEYVKMAEKRITNTVYQKKLFD